MSFFDDTLPDNLPAPKRMTAREYIEKSLRHAGQTTVTPEEFDRAVEKVEEATRELTAELDWSPLKHEIDVLVVEAEAKLAEANLIIRRAEKIKPGEFKEVCVVEKQGSMSSGTCMCLRFKRLGVCYHTGTLADIEAVERNLHDTH